MCVTLILWFIWNVSFKPNENQKQQQNVKEKQKINVI